MQVVKESDQGLLINYFGAQGKTYLAVAHLSLFDLNDPDNVLSEQDLWPLVQSELGQTVFDMGLPKPLGEVLVRGKCFSPQGRPVRAVRAGLGIGPIRKDLLVFGFRHWSSTTLGGQHISEPLPFTEIDLAYQNAFGGRKFPLNPMGMGLDKTQFTTGETGRPLPYLENPNHLISHMDDRPEPAGFGPLDLTWPQRSRKMGTYDQRWLDERWPFFPDDTDWRFANAAPADQWLPPSYHDGFFKGDESIIMRHLHPRFDEYQSRLPAFRPRCFIEQLEDLGRPKGNRFFKEVELRLETVWLFPHRERGVIIHRGTTEVADDEGRDVPLIYLAKENIRENRHTIEHYRAHLAEKLRRITPRDLEPLKDADSLLDQARAKLDELPGLVEDVLKKLQGKAPIPRDTPEETASKALQSIADHQASLAGFSEQLEQTRRGFGHHLKIDTAGINSAGLALDNLKDTVHKSMATLDRSRRHIADLQDQGRAEAEKGMAGLPPELKDGAPDIPREMTAPGDIPPPEERWQNQAMRFVQRCRESTTEDSRGIELYKWIGLTNQTIRRSWIGYNPSNLEVSRFEWGLADSPEDDSTMILPEGITQPYFNDAELCHLRIRPPVAGFEWLSGEVEGSGQRLMFLSPRSGRPLLVLNFCIEAWLAKQEFGHLCDIVCMAGPDLDLSPEQQDILARAPQMLVLEYPLHRVIFTPYPLEAWQKLNPDAEIIKVPRRASSLIEANKMGLNLEDWIRSLIKPELLPEEAPKSIIDQLPPYDLDAGEFLARRRKEIEALLQTKLDAMEKLAAGGVAKIQAGCQAAGFEPPGLDDILPKASPEAIGDGNPIPAAKAKLAACMADMRSQLNSSNPAPPADIEEKLTEIEKDFTKTLDRAEARYGKATAKLKELASDRPQWARDLVQELGFDPDDRESLHHLTREDVAQAQTEGRSLAGKNLAGLDLSGMDLSGLDMSGANLQQTVFTGSRLAGADLSGALAEDTDFSGATMEEARLTGAVLTRAKFPGAQLGRTDLTQTMFKQTDFSNTNLEGARIDRACFDQTKCQGARLNGVSGEQAAFLNTGFEGGSFHGARLARASFLECQAHEVDFTESDLSSVNFISTTGHGADFTGANLTNARFMQQSAFQDSDFNQVSAERMFGQHTDLSGCHFKGAVMNRALIEECNLSGADLTGAVAREARFNKSDLNMAGLTGIDMMYGSLRKAGLGFTNMSAANFFGAEFYKTRISETAARHTNFKRTKLEKVAEQIFGVHDHSAHHPGFKANPKDGRHEP